MSSLLDEEVYRVPPMSTRSADRLARLVLEEIAPLHLKAPGPLDLEPLVHGGLEKFGIYVVPVSDVSMGFDLGRTDIVDDHTEIHLAEATWNPLLVGGRFAHRAKATVAHELGHAIVHMPYARAARESRTSTTALNRQPRRDLRPFEDPEWQAWAIGSSLLMPFTTLSMLKSHVPSDVAEIYDVSVQLAEKHLRRLKLIP